MAKWVLFEGGEHHYGTKRERTLAVTWGPWGGVWFVGARRLVWRLCLGFVAITYVPAEMTQILEAWLNQQNAAEDRQEWFEQVSK